MASDTKMLQILIDGQVSIKQGLNKLEKRMNEGFKNVDARFDKTDKRIDKLGMQLANLEDDAPTIDEFDNLEKRVTKLEHPQFASS